VRSNKIPLETVGIGIVASAAILVFLAGQKRKATTNTIFLIHNIIRRYGKETFNPIQVEEISSEMRAETTIFAEIVANETKITKGQALRMIKGKKHLVLRVKEAKNKGLIDKVIS
jgi:ATP-dependent protease ClpP protease subunit